MTTNLDDLHSSLLGSPESTPLRTSTRSGARRSSGPSVVARACPYLPHLLVNERDDLLSHPRGGGRRRILGLVHPSERSHGGVRRRIPGREPIGRTLE